VLATNAAEPIPARTSAVAAKVTGSARVSPRPTMVRAATTARTTPVEPATSAAAMLLVAFVIPLLGVLAAALTRPGKHADMQDEHVRRYR
jgi:hypothetical protein